MSAEPRVDGRRLRAARTRAAILDAVLDLMGEGDLRPTAPRVAERAEVSLRTVYQRFADLEGLFVAASERQIERITELFEPIRPDVPLPERLRTYVRQRCRVLEVVTPFARAVEHLERSSARIRQEGQRLRELARQDVAATFAAELDELDDARRAVLLSSLDVVSTWRTWEALRGEQQQPAEAAEGIVRFQLAAALAAMGFDAG